MPSALRKTARLLLVTTLLATAILHWAARPRLLHGLTANYYEDPSFNWADITRIERIAFLTSNDTRTSANRPFRATWDGYIFVHDPTEASFLIPTDLDSRLTIDGAILFDTTYAHTEVSNKVNHVLNPGSHPISFELVRHDTTPRYFSSGLQWSTIIGDRPIAADHLYPTSPDSAEATQEIRLGTARRVIRLIGASSLLGLLITSFGHWHRILRRRETYIITGLMALAMVLRLQHVNSLLQQTQHPYLLAQGSDQQTYVSNALDLARGLWPPEREFYRQPGYTWLLGNIHALFGPILHLIQIIQIASGSLATAAVFLISRRLFSMGAAFLAGLLWASFPLAIFYDAQFLTHALEGHLVIWSSLLWIHTIIAIRSGQPPLLHAAFLGLALGAGAVLRPPILVLIPIALVSLVLCLDNNRASAIKPAAILGLAALIPIAPVTAHNYINSGDFQLLNSSGPVTLYLGNNRDSAGIGQHSSAFRATHEYVNRGETSYVRQTFDDIRADPRRWIGLMLRKSALYWGNLEIADNVDYYRQGIASSSVVRMMPHSYGLIASLAPLGLFLSLTSLRPFKPGIYILSTVVVVLFTTTAIFHVVSRFRVPTYGPLIVFTSFAITGALRQLQSPNRRTTATAVAVAVVSTTLVAASPWLANHALPLPVVKSLPLEASRDSTAFGDHITLLGQEHLGAVEPGQPIFVTLYWTSESQMPQDYDASIQLITPQGHKLAQADQVIGAGSFPVYASASWRPGEIVRDQYLLFPPLDAKIPSVLNILVAVYDRSADTRIGDTISGQLSLTTKEPLLLPNTAIPINATFGQAHLAGYDHLLDSDHLNLTLYWTSLAQSLPDGTIFMHVFNAGGHYILGSDSPPLNGAYPFSAWQPGEMVTHTHHLFSGDLVPGHYDVHIGVYNPETGARWPIVDYAANMPHDSSLLLHKLTID